MEIFAIAEFAEMVERGKFNKNNGYGHLHDGVKETNISVWKHNLFNDDVQKKYPYVTWHKVR